MRIAEGLIFAGARLAGRLKRGMVADPGCEERSGPAGGTAVPLPAAVPAPAKAACANPNALGIGRTVEIDTTGGPGFGFEHFKQLDFLRDMKWC